MSLPQTYLHTITTPEKSFSLLSHRAIRCQAIRWMIATLAFVALFGLAAQWTTLRASAAQYGWQRASASLLSASTMRARVALKRMSGGKLFANATMFAPTLGLTKALVSSPSDIPTGRVFTYRLTWRCAGAVSPADDCFNLKITDQLPAYIEYVPPATFASPVVSVAPSGTAAADGTTRQTLTVAFDAVVPAVRPA